MAGGATTIFIDPQYLRVNSIINDNVDAKVLQPLIRMSQDKYIQQAIGTSLYVKFLDLVDAAAPTNPIPVPIIGDDKILLEQYIIPTLVQYTVWESMPYMQFKMRNKGVSKQSSDNSEPVDLTELVYFRENVLNTAEFYAQRMIKYLCENASLYPDFRNGNEDLKPQKTAYFNGIHIPSRNCINNPFYTGPHNGYNEINGGGIGG